MKYERHKCLGLLDCMFFLNKLMSVIYAIYAAKGSLQTSFVWQKADTDYGCELSMYLRWRRCRVVYNITPHFTKVKGY